MSRTLSLSYLEALKNKRLAAFLSGDLVSRIGDGMTLVALPVLVLGLPSEVPAAVRLSLVYAVPLAAPLIVSLFFGLGTKRFDPAVTIAADSALRILFYGLAAGLALGGTLTFGWLLVAWTATRPKAGPADSDAGPHCCRRNRRRGSRKRCLTPRPHGHGKSYFLRAFPAHMWTTGPT